MGPRRDPRARRRGSPASWSCPSPRGPGRGPDRESARRPRAGRRRAAPRRARSWACGRRRRTAGAPPRLARPPLDGAPPSAERRPMSSRSSPAASPTPRLRGSSACSPKGKPTQNGRPRPTSGWMKRRRTSPACPANSSAVPLQYQRPTDGSPPNRGRCGSPGSSVHERREAKRMPGAAAAARWARSRRLRTSKKTSLGPAAASADAGAPVVGSLVGGGAHGVAGRACVHRPAGHRR